MTSTQTPATSETFTCGDMRLQYRDTGEAVAMELLPLACVDEVVEPRLNLGATEDAAEIERFANVPVRRAEPLIQIRRTGDVSGDGHHPGLSMRYSRSTASLKLRDIEKVAENEDELRLVVRLATEDGLTAEQHVHWRTGWPSLRVWTEVENTANQAFDLELVTSFSLGGLTPFATDDAPGRLYVHRFRSGWSSEGRHERRLAEDLGLERSWAPFSLMNERFGQRGSKPNRGFAPWVGVEDERAGVMWAAHLEAPGSWQCEVGRRDDAMSMAGGLADREYGHWKKTLEPGSRFATPAAWLTTCRGDLDDACARLLKPQGPTVPAPSESELPVMFNEWCTTWGTPSHDNLLAIADRLRGTPCRYLVIDAGWYKPASGQWASAQGDWEPSPELFPHGLEKTCEEIRKRGLTPGLWFEFEVASVHSEYSRSRDRLLHLDGHTLQAGARCFLDFRQQENHAYLAQRVIEQMQRCGIQYIKVDYNASVGIGCDGAESPGEGLRQHVEGVQRFFRMMRERMPELVIENCSSGGQRAEPCFGALSDMHSFSDAHTCRDIPVVAANMARLIPARQNQIWAVLMPGEDLQRITYSLAATFIGRMCLSGEIWSLDDAQMEVTRKAMQLYNRAAPVLRDGSARRFGNWSPASRHLTGWQAVTHTSETGTVAVVHVFGDGAKPDAIPVPGRRRIEGELTSNDTRARLDGETLTLSNMPAWSAAVVLLQ